MIDPSRRNRFTALSLDRHDALRNNPATLAALWNDARVVAVDFEGNAAGDANAPFAFDSAQLPPLLHEAACFLGHNPGEPAWFALPASVLSESLKATVPGWIDLRTAARHWGAFDSALFAYAKALLLWQSRARHCGVCGAATVLTRAGHCAQCSNAECGFQQFPRTDAAIIVLVRDGERALLGRSPGWPVNRYSTLAGFVEPGESLEDAVRREVAEESGVVVGGVRYHSSQPWPFPGSLMVAFDAEAADASIQLGDELEDARWFTPAELADAIRHGTVKLPPPIAVSRQLVDDWLVEHLGEHIVAELSARPA